MENPSIYPAQIQSHKFYVPHVLNLWFRQAGFGALRVRPPYWSNRALKDIRRSRISSCDFPQNRVGDGRAPTSGFPNPQIRYGPLGAWGQTRS